MHEFWVYRALQMFGGPGSSVEAGFILVEDLYFGVMFPKLFIKIIRNMNFYAENFR